MKETFDEWEKAFRRRTVLSDVRKKLECIDPEAYPLLENNIIKACFHAVHFEPDADPAETYRKQERILKLGLAQKRIREIERLRGFFECNDKILTRVIEKNLPADGVSFRSLEDIDDFLADLLVLFDCLEEGENYNDVLFPESFTYGNLKYEDALDTDGKFKRASPTTLLIFELAAHFRCWTCADMDYSSVMQKRLEGLTMPKSGSPNHALIAELVNESFSKQQKHSRHEPDKFTTDMVKSRLKDIPPNTLLINWGGETDA